MAGGKEQGWSGGWTIQWVKTGVCCYVVIHATSELLTLSLSLSLYKPQLFNEVPSLFWRLCLFGRGSARRKIVSTKRLMNWQRQRKMRIWNFCKFFLAIELFDIPLTQLNIINFCNITARPMVYDLSFYHQENVVKEMKSLWWWWKKWDQNGWICYMCPLLQAGNNLKGCGAI